MGKHHLIYHITPMGKWRDNLTTLMPYLRVFNGVKLAVFYQGEGMEPIEELGAFVDLFDEVFILPNSTTLRETPSMFHLLERLQERVADGVAFFGHTKGITYGPEKHTNWHHAVRIWTVACYEKNLEDIPRVDALLEAFPVVGTFRRVGVFSNFPPNSIWHYSGTFFWFDVAALWSRDWRSIFHMSKYGAEAFPGLVFDYKESACIFGDNPNSMYDLANAQRVMRGGRALGE